MKLLLDTCTFLWVISDDPALSPSAKALVADPEHDVYLSAASAWEIAVKHALGKLPLPSPPEVLVPTQRTRHRIDALPIREDVALHTRRLPALHRDPVDRLLVAQAIVDGMTLVTPDPLVCQYPAPVVW
jgi:PIN domain nuclease of toxin-antitoxin system